MADRLNPFLEDIEDENILESNETSKTDESVEYDNQSIGQTNTADVTSIDNVAIKLLRENFLLTALELHFELIELGKELPRLRDFFSNPAHFSKSRTAQEAVNIPRTSSIQTFDSLDLARYSDDGEQHENDKVAVLEFELRKAQETIKLLRTTLTKSAEPDQAIPDSDSGQLVEDVHQDIKAYEVRAINFLVHEYLLKHNYKLTSVTFAEENEDQDFEDWDDVGLNMAKPPDLLHLYRDYGQRVWPMIATKDTGSQISDSELLQDELYELHQQHDKLKVHIQQLEEQISSLTSENAFLGNLIKQHEKSGLMVGRSSTPLVSPAGTPTKNSAGTQPSDPKTAEKVDRCSTDLGERFMPEGESLSGDSEPGDLIEDQVCTVDRPGKDLIGQQQDTSRYVSESSELAADSVIVQVGSATNSLLEQEEECDEVMEVVSDETVSYRDVTVILPPHLSNRRTPSTFLQALLTMNLESYDENRIVTEMTRISCLSPSKVIYMLSRCLPHIVPNVLLAKREELIPAIMSTAILHPDAKERDQLLNILFNLIKRPDKSQRQMILLGCGAFARHAGPERTEAELLPQCWEQLSHKHPERRLLVAEACGTLAPYLKPELRGSLVLSMLQQMLGEEKDEEVRAGVIASLGVLVGLLEDEEKYSVVGDIMMKALSDPVGRVASIAQTLLLPSYAMWSLELGTLETQLIPRFVRKLQGLVKSGAQNTILDKSGFCLYIRCLQQVTPLLFMNVVQTGPFCVQGQTITSPAVGKHNFGASPNRLSSLEVLMGGSGVMQVAVHQYDTYVSEEWYEPWTPYTWLLADFIPELISLMNQLDPLQPDIVHVLVQYFRHLCGVFGRQLTVTKIQQKFQKVLSLPTKDSDLSPDNVCVALTKITVPVFAAGVISAFHEEADESSLKNFLQSLLNTLACSQVSLNSVRAVITELCYDAHYHEVLLKILWGNVVDSSKQLRQAAALLLEEAVRGVSEALVSQRIVPALITLASDPELSVRVATVPAYGTIAELVRDRTTLEKIYLQLQTFMDESSYNNNQLMMVELTKTFARVGPNVEPKFRDESILPRLAIFAAANNHQSNPVMKKELVIQLFEAYSKIACCFISDHLMNECLLPGLRYLHRDVLEVAQDMVPIVESMIKEFQEKLEASQLSTDRLPGAQTGGQADKLKSTMFGRFKDVTSRLGGSTTTPKK